ncbi:MAG: response regulator [Planctomycetes bacterium]|nr:response regulator [Planctomycetota bacterium]
MLLTQLAELDVQAEPVDRKHKRSEYARHEQGRRSEFSVLLVEDDPGHARLISKALANSSAAKVAVATTGEDAVRTLWQTDEQDEFVCPPKLVLLDLGLPGMSGLDVLVKIKSDRQLRRTPVVMLSASDDPASIERCLNAGANAFVTKSANPDDLRDSLSRIAGFWESESRLPEKVSLN